MQPNARLSNAVTQIAIKESLLFFASPIAYLFLAAFAAVTLFTFFWGEAFFSRNIADVRPLFDWMPILLIFLASTLTMRMWSEERRSGTLEHVLTQPLPIWHFVVGKFSACMLLLIIALMITLPLPLTVAILGDLDWGPVWSGYLATLLLGAAYIAIGLFVSARSDNQIVSLIGAVALSGFLYLLGAPAITELFGNQIGEWLRMVGTGSRFESITRGVIDFRDLYYYLSLVVVFMALNSFTLERERWAVTGNSHHHRLWKGVTGLLVINALAANLWIGQINNLRLDTTEGELYSISDATQSYLKQLREPLLIRGYFSSKTHPLLAPLVPQIRDLIEEYEVAGNGRVRAEFIDPVKEPELEEEANQKYGIKAVPFQVADRYQSALVNSYFNILVQYGDQFETIDFRDLIEMKARSETDIDVVLRNPEYDITSVIKKVLHGYQAGGNIFDNLDRPIAMNAYISEDAALPKQLQDLKVDLQDLGREFAEISGGKFTLTVENPDADGGVVADRIEKDFGFRAMTTSLLSDERFFFYITISRGEQVIQIPHGDLSKDALKRNIESGIKRFGGGFTKTVALVAPRLDPQMLRYGMRGPQYNDIQEYLGADYNIKHEDLSDGSIDGEADILLLVAPKEIDAKGIFAVDQFLMQGGTVVLATSAFSANLAGDALMLDEHKSGLEEWLTHHGLGIGKSLVMDPQNAAFPIPVTRSVGGFQFQEVRMLDYPYFIDVRAPGLSEENPMTADVGQVTLAWASPIEVDQQRQDERRLTSLMQSSEKAWLSKSTEVMPKVTAAGSSGFNPEGEIGQYLLGVVSEGVFTSYFQDKESPLLTEERDRDETADAVIEGSEEADAIPPVVSSVIPLSSESARIILFSSNDFLRDEIIRLNGSAGGSDYLQSLQLMVNSLDWSLEDQGLLSIRSRGHFNRTLMAMEHDAQLFWEYLNYALAILALVTIAWWQRRLLRQRQKNQLARFAG